MGTLYNFMGEISTYSKRITPEIREKAKDSNISTDNSPVLKTYISKWIKGVYDEDPDYLADDLIQLLKNKTVEESIRRVIREEIKSVLQEGFFSNFLDGLAKTIKNDNVDFLIKHLDSYDESLAQRVKNVNVAWDNVNKWLKNGDKLSKEDQAQIIKLIHKANK